MDKIILLPGLVAIMALMMLAACSHVPKDDFNYPLKAHDITEGPPGGSALRNTSQDLRQSNQFSMLSKQVVFDHASAELNASSKTALDQMADLMKSKGASFEKIRIAGFTDASGSASRNLKLSQARADNVRKYLISKGVPATKLEAIGMGSITYGDHETGLYDKSQAADRRVDFEIVQ